MVTAMNKLTGSNESQDFYERTVKDMQRELAFCEQAFGKDHSKVASILNRLASFCKTQGHPAEAEPLYLRLLAITEQTHGKDHPEVASVLDDLIELYEAQGRSAETEPLLQRAVAIYEKAHGPVDQSVAAALNNLALVYHGQVPFYLKFKEQKNECYTRRNSFYSRKCSYF